MDLGQAIINLGRQMPSLYLLVKVVAWAVGLTLMGVAVFKAIQASRNHGHVDGMQPVTLAFVATLFCGLGELAGAISASLGISGNDVSAIIGYLPQSGPLAAFSIAAIGAAFMIAAFFGWYSLFSGVRLWKNASEGKGQGNEVGRGFAHIIFGVCCINAGATLGTLLKSLAG
jgi:hypothetical protein